MEQHWVNHVVTETPAELGPRNCHSESLLPRSNIILDNYIDYNKRFLAAARQMEEPRRETAQSKRPRSTLACKRCRMSKRRCEGGRPCLKCSSRGLKCDSEQEPEVNEECNPTSNAGRLEMKFDLPFTARTITTKLIDRYFSVIAPHWTIVTEDDLQQVPYVSPVLLRSLCLVSAHLAGPSERDLAENIGASIRQCFEAHELLCLPTLSTLRAILLLLTSPFFSSQSSILTNCACRMALILGLHQPGHPRPELYWSCIIAARWQSLKNSGYGMPVRHCFDLDTAQPQSEPDHDSLFGALYHLLARIESTKQAQWLTDMTSSTSAPITTYDPQGTSFFITSNGGYDPNSFRLLEMLNKYLFGEMPYPDTLAMDMQLSPAFELYPFYAIRHGLGPS